MARWLVGLALLAVALLVAWQAGWLADLGLDSRGAPGTEEGALLEAGTSDPAVPTDRASLAGREGTKSVLPAAPAPIAGPRITGRVLDKAERGIAGARVVSLPDTNAKTLRFEEFGKEGGAGFAATTDAEGRFVVAVSKEAPYHFLAASAPGFGIGVKPDVAPGTDVVLVLEPSQTQTGVVKDKDGKGIVGARVRALLLVDTIRVELEARSGEGGAYRLEGLPPERKMPPSGWIGFISYGWCEVTAEGFAPLWTGYRVFGTASPLPALDFTLLRGATIVGRVEDAETGQPVPGVTVSLYSREGSMGFVRSGLATVQNPYAPRELARLKGDEKGVFRLEHVPCEATAAPAGGPMGGERIGGVVAWAAGYTAAVHDLTRPTDGASIDVTLKLWPAVTITGRVVTADGKPAEDVSVGGTVAGKEQKGHVPPILEGVPRTWATTTADGRYRMDGVPAAREGATSVLLKAHFRRTGRRAWTPSRPEGDASKTVSVKVGEALDAGDLVLAGDDPLPTTTVRVLLPDGRPCFGAKVGASEATPRTDADGRCEMVWAKPKEGQVFPSVDQLVRARGYAPTVVTTHPPGSGKEHVEVTLLPAHRVTGSVVLADGAPGAGLAVCVGDGSLKLDAVFPDRGNEHLHQQLEGTRARALPVIYALAYAGEDGTFVCDDLPDGPYHVRATKARRVGGNERPLAALASGVASGADVALRIPVDDSPATGSMRVVATDAGGKPVSGFSVQVKRGTDVVASGSPVGGRFPSPSGSAAAGHSPGTLTVPLVPVGTYRVEVTAAGFRTGRAEGVDVRADAETALAIALDAGIAVVGRIVPPPGHEVKGRPLQFRDLGRPETSRALAGPVAADGTFRVTGFEPGRYRVVLTNPFSAGASGPAPLVPAGGEDVVVVAGSDTRFDVEWIAAGTLTLRPEDERLPAAPWNQDRGAPTEEQKKFGAATRVSVRGPAGVVVDVTGVRRMDVGFHSWMNLPPGTYTARIEFPGGESREETVDLKVGAQADVYFRKR